MRRDQPLRAVFKIAQAVFILALIGCQSQVNLPVSPDLSETAPVTREISLNPTSEPTPAPSVSLALLGDVMLGRDIHPNSETFAYLKPFLKTADLALANLESPLTDSPVQTTSPYALCASPENVNYLVEAGFDTLALANNHRLDCGTQGLADTQQTLRESGLGFLGSNPEPVYRTINGIQLAFLAFDATNQFDVEAAIQAVQSARERDALVVVSIHWGMEYQSGPSTDQQQIARRLAEAGGTLIWGHHPHVLQPAEWIGKTLVLYSLGNALFDQYGLESTRRSALVLVRLDARGVEGFKVMPFLIDIRHSRIVEPSQTDAQIIMQYFK